MLDIHTANEFKPIQRSKKERKDDTVPSGLISQYNFNSRWIAPIAD
jgi:hypothetical protein